MFDNLFLASFNLHTVTYGMGECSQHTSDRMVRIVIAPDQTIARLKVEQEYNRDEPYSERIEVVELEITSAIK